MLLKYVTKILFLNVYNAYMNKLLGKMCKM